VELWQSAAVNLALWIYLEGNRWKECKFPTKKKLFLPYTEMNDGQILLSFLGGGRRQEHALCGNRMNTQGCHPKQFHQPAGTGDGCT